jgi:hypothetical protein
MLASLYRGVSRSKLWRGQNRSAAKICLSLTSARSLNTEVKHSRKMKRSIEEVNLDSPYKFSYSITKHLPASIHNAVADPPLAVKQNYWVNNYYISVTLYWQCLATTVHPQRASDILNNY